MMEIVTAYSCAMIMRCFNLVTYTQQQDQVTSVSNHSTEHPGTS